MAWIYIYFRWFFWIIHRYSEGSLQLIHGIYDQWSLSCMTSSLGMLRDEDRLIFLAMTLLWQSGAIAWSLWKIDDAKPYKSLQIRDRRGHDDGFYSRSDLPLSTPDTCRERWWVDASTGWQCRAWLGILIVGSRELCRRGGINDHPWGFDAEMGVVWRGKWRVSGG